jgi:hypothetical protein
VPNPEVFLPIGRPVCFAVDAVRKAIHQRDAFTRMEAKKDRERAEWIRAKNAGLERRNRERAQRSRVRDDLARLFTETTRGSGESSWKAC